MEAKSFSETSVNFYQTARRNKAKDSRTDTSRCKNLKSQMSTGSGSSSKRNVDVNFA
jgi:hypothetical protein